MLTYSMLNMFLLVPILLHAAVVSKKPCLHHGCFFNSGLKVMHLNNTIESLLQNGEVEENVVRILQWNILYDKHDIGKDNWIYRKQDVCNYVRQIQPTFMGLQEVMENQLQFLQSCLPEYNFIGSKRADVKGELYNPIFYKQSDRIKLLDSGTFWLSKTPKKQGSRLKTSKEPRICTWGKFQYALKKKGAYVWKTVVVATTHLTWRKEAVARDQMLIALNYLKNNNRTQGGHPVVLTGDFNWEDTSLMYAATIQKNWLTNTMTHSRKAIPDLTALPPYPGLVDYVWENGFDSLLSATMADNRTNGRHLSDHRAVFAALLFK